MSRDDGDDRRTDALADSDADAVRRASRRVGWQITLATAVVVFAAIGAVFFFVLSRIRPGELFELVPDRNNIDISANDLLLLALVLGTVGVVLAGVLSWIIARRAVRPLGDALRIQRAFIADASHELRTPLTVLDARLQVLQRSLAADDPSTPVVAELRRDARSLMDVVNDLLEAAEAASSRGDDTGPEDLTEIAELAVESMRVVGQDRNVGIELDAPGPLFTPLPAVSAHRCLVALLDNALRYSPDGSMVTVTLRGTKNRVSLEVKDQGPGIRGISPDRVFDRFAKSGDATGGGGTTRTGFGIGLALVRDIAVSHGGTVSVKETSANGTVVVLTVPRASERG
ncbi:sensor histidine kinase [Lacisediminihabitans profunda]|uniref:histidine kinase n=1 Tax=Lacisediminihabitans profunda TaxID=2594790 RepID=A0A5C8UU96_9MICO|nr:HAMP domain-containing sensor histidine kinase [Lacisediminihabitans profunda]TXN32114.1 HAMP domain-containing histidine kinase [Lacisediminihabitans profunda]